MEVSVEPKQAVNGVIYPFHCHETGRDGPGRLAGAHLHNYIELLYCTQGCAELLIGESVCRFTPGDLALINSHEVHSVEAIDPVRYLTNKSSGKMGYAIAAAAARRGAEVTLISGPVAL